jgi:acetyltransferase-like isoleucine patch superfamily enzyme
VQLVGRPEHISIGKSVVLETGVKLTVSNLCRNEKALVIGNETFVGRFSVITARERVIIGCKVLIAPFCYISETNHGLAKGIPIQDQPSPWGNISINDGVWIGNGCTILPGVTIGEGAVIGANSVVNADIPPNAIAVGSPARIVKYREF